MNEKREASYRSTKQMDALDHVCTELLLVFRTLNDENPSLYVPKLSEMVVIISEFNQKFINYS